MDDRAFDYLLQVGPSKWDRKHVSGYRGLIFNARFLSQNLHEKPFEQVLKSW